MKDDKERPVFYDHGGKRWRKIKLLMLLIAAGVTALCVYVVPNSWRLAQVTHFASPDTTAIAAPLKPTTTPPAELADYINLNNVPVIGSGPLARVVQVAQTPQGYVSVPVYGNGETNKLTTADAHAVGNHMYAIERYGQISGKRIALTFDDGPDPIWTPKILDELSRHQVPSTFFAVGREVVKYPDVTQRIVREGHVVGNHTFNHINFDTVTEIQATQEINQSQRVIRAVTGHSTSFFRLPYGGNDPQSLRDFVRGILEAQEQGYTVSYYEFDTNDWGFTGNVKPALPNFDGSGMVALMHDGGGDRSRTLSYLTTFIKEARAHGYTFVTLDQLYSQSDPLFAPAKASLADQTTLHAARAYLVWPATLINKLFVVAVFSVVISMIINVALAGIGIRRTHYKRRKNGYEPFVSIIVPAYNEEAVLIKNVLSLLRSRYRYIEVIIVDDGSKDNTWKIARQLAERPKVQAFHRKNGGKSRALNFGIKKARGDIIVSIDADTILPPQAVGKLVRHFADPAVGAVAGAVKVGNIQNALSLWQSLDYIIGIHIERNAQALLGAVMIVPGACGAWRKEAVKKAHGYSASTLAEDFDLTLAMHNLGYKVLQDNAVISYTEAPLTIRALFRQRFRWIFGDIQTFWKYRRLIFNRKHRWLGWYALPMAVFSIFMPLIFGPLLLVLGFQNLLSGNYEILIIYFFATLALQFLLAVIALLIARERPLHLAVVPLTRLLYEPIRWFILYRSVMRALKGAYVGWNKLHRTGTVSIQYQRQQRRLAFMRIHR